MDECKIDISLGATSGTDHFEKAILHVARYVTSKISMITVVMIIVSNSKLVYVCNLVRQICSWRFLSSFLESRHIWGTLGRYGTMGEILQP